jgi:IS5 family transposase
MHSGQTQEAQSVHRSGVLEFARQAMKTSIRAKVEHPFRVLKRQFGLRKARLRRLGQDTAQIVTLPAPSDLWMARRQLLEVEG